MSVSNGQDANQTTFNNAFISRTIDDNTVGRKDLQNTNPASGPSVINVQREVNSLNSFSGRSSGSAFDAKPTWTNNDVGSSTDDLKTRVDLLTQKFNASLGHKHTGGGGDAPQIDGDSIATPLRGFIVQGIDLTGVTGGTHDVSSELPTQSPSPLSTVAGIPTTSPYNKILIRYTSSFDPIEDGSGNQVYARITNTGGVGGTWTLTFYVNIAGTETAHSLTGSNAVSWWYQELFNPLSADRPVYSEDFFYPSDNVVADMPDATASQAGKVSTAAQTFGGEKNFDGGFATEHQNVASAASIINLSSSQSFVRITGSTATSLKGITAPASAESKRILIHNNCSQTVTIENQDAGASASNRIITPDGDPIAVATNSSIELIYDTVQSRWVVVSSGVGGGGSSVVGYPESIGTGDGTNDTFGPLTFIPVSEDSVWVFVDSLWVPPGEWSLVGSDIVFGGPYIPASGQSVHAHYLTNGAPAVPVLPSGTFQSYEHTVTSGEESAKQITLSPAPASATSVAVFVKGAAGPEFFGDGYTISGAVFDWDGFDLDGVLVTGDKIRFLYVT